jgi:hypothetical protein
VGFRIIRVIEDKKIRFFAISVASKIFCPQLV